MSLQPRAPGAMIARRGGAAGIHHTVSARSRADGTDMTRDPQKRERLQAMADRLEVAATWEELTLSESGRTCLREAVRRLGSTRNGSAAGESGTCLLFAGASGTDKTLAAALFAKELGREAYRVDLSRVVSQYIGETEKNLARLFEAAASSGAVLFFDEADALFGKRSDTSEGDNPLASIEPGYLLERIKSHRGVTLLATGAQQPVDESLAKLIDCIVEVRHGDD